MPAKGSLGLFIVRRATSAKRWLWRFAKRDTRRCIIMQEWKRTTAGWQKHVSSVRMG